LVRAEARNSLEQRTAQISQLSGLADSPGIRAGQSARGKAQTQKQRRRGLSAVYRRTVRESTKTVGQQRGEKFILQNKLSDRGQSATGGADSPPKKTATRTEAKLKGGRSARRNRTVRRQSTENRQVLNQTFKSSSNSKSIQMTSDEAQISDTEHLDHHEGNPKRSKQKDQSFMNKSIKFGLKLGFSPKGEFERFFKRNRFQP
jgi:hypothetical protein